MARRGISNLDLDVLPPIATLWALRLLDFFGVDASLGQHGNNRALIRTLGLSKLFEAAEDEPPAREIRKRIRLRYQQSERHFGKASLPSLLAENIARLAEVIGLTPTEGRILGFVALLHTQRVLDEVSDVLGSLSTAAMYRVVSVALDIPEADVRAALIAKGGLIRCGLLQIDNDNEPLARKFNASRSFFHTLCQQEAEPLHLLRDRLAPSAPGHLALSDYAHLEPRLETLRVFLRESVATARKGVNVFLYGPPGTGKTQLVKTLAEDSGLKLFEVSQEDEDGDPIKGESRLQAFRAAQSILAGQRVMLMFDEAEDVFSDGCLTQRSTAQQHKAWINRWLEENRVPTLWLSNSVAGIDAAFIRRFDMMLELPVPPKRVREGILREACGDLLKPTAIARVAESECLTPAVVTRAASVAALVRGELGPEKSAAAFESLINGTLEAQGHRPVKRHDPERLPEVYDPAFINADADLARITEGLAAAGCGRLCLYGPPGTGKTAFGRWLAERLERPLLVRRASDLLSMWVGGTEANIARAFRQAEQESALFLIDEVDSFLQDRRGAQRSWEVTEVNEMLTRIESFPGVLIASTNLMDGLDPAALRRFDYKVRLDYLRSAQAAAMLEKYCASWGIVLGAEETERLKSLSLTPGDYAVVARRHRFAPYRDAGAVVEDLRAEAALRQPVGRRMGFL
ncbi:MAG: AAA family ATPase [Candidatus Accumulibacter sp.]|nr:AAA family ATPase [Accumulibacter sp.]